VKNNLQSFLEQLSSEQKNTKQNIATALSEVLVDIKKVSELAQSGQRDQIEEIPNALAQMAQTILEVKDEINQWVNQQSQ